MNITGQVPIYATPDAPEHELCRLERAPHNQSLTAVLVHPSRWREFERVLEAAETRLLDQRIWEALRPAVDLVHDPHLSDSSTARASGPHATLACAECCRARWMHATRHDTCGQFSWVHASTMSDELVGVVRLVPGVSQELAAACSRALWGSDLGPRREGKRAVAAAVNAAMNRHAGPLNAEVRP